MNLANFLTCSRFVFTACFIFFLFSSDPSGKLWALIFFVTASVTDYLDGVAARRMGQISAFGKMMDPLADKALMLSAFFSFWWLGLIPLWMVIVVVLRDVLVTGARFVMPADSPGRSVRQSGKQKTVLQMVFIVSVLLYLIAAPSPYWPVAWDLHVILVIRIAMGVIVAFTVWTGLRVFIKNA